MPLDLPLPARLVAIAGGGVAIALMAVGLFVWAAPPTPPAVAAVPPAVIAPVPDGRNAYKRYVQAADGMRFLVAPEGQSWGLYLRRHFLDPKLPPELQRFVADNRPALAALREARALAGYQSVPPQEDWGGTRPIFRRFQLLGRLGTVAGRQAIAEGRYAEGFAHILDVVALGRRGMQSPGEPLHSGSVGSAILRRQWQALRADAAAIDRAPTPALAGFLQGLNAIDRQERPVEEWLVRERDAFLAQLGRQLWNDGMPPAQQAEVMVKAQAVLDHQIALVRTRDLRARELETLKYRDPGAQLTPRLAFHGREMAAFIPLSGLLPGLNRAEFRLWIAEAEFDAWRVRLAAMLHHRRHGAWPATLEALVPTYLPAVPPDPFQAGVPLRFAGGKLWSAGWDGQDQQAALPIPYDRPGYRFRPLEQEGDLILLDLTAVKP